ncbi:MAG: diaminopimelate decarboxylase [Verrucomicrobia bacterium]|nr:MAG: diaminopimelate decarboxylase [Verrucomicrobiota bacterium]
MHRFYLREGTLYCEEQDLFELAAQYGTPLYVYSASTIRDNFRRLEAAFSPLNHLICYAVKANSNLSLLHSLAKLGSGFDIVSGGELYRVLQAGGQADRCVFAGVGKTRQEIQYAIEQGVYCFNVECEGELETINEIAGTLGKKAPIAIRINPDVDARTHRYISTGKTHNKFGIGLDRAGEIYSYAARLPNLQIRGIQTHIGSQVLSIQPFLEAIQKLLPFVKQLKEDSSIEFFSVGGGVGIVYAEALESGSPEWWQKTHPTPITFEEYAAELLPLLAPLGLKILFEPGRSIIGNAGVLITQVVQIKKNPAKRFVIVDSGMNDLIRPALYEAFHQVVPLKPTPPHPGDLADLVGPVCESGDFFLQDAKLPDLKPGDYLALMSAGAYGFVMSSHYNSRPLAAEVLVDGSRSFLIRERESWKDLIRAESALLAQFQ